MVADNPLKKIRRLSQALMISGAINIGVLAFFTYWIMKERPPTPYCELKPAESGEQQMPLADQRNSVEVLSRLYKFSFSQLISCLENAQLVENGYAVRDLSLACLVAFHDFDVLRALGVQPKQQRVFAWKLGAAEEPASLTVYPNLTTSQYEAIIRFAKTEQWPMTAKGLFRSLQKQQEQANVDPSLIETFMLTPEFWTVEPLFKRLEQPVRKQVILEILLEGDWNLLKQFVDQQRQHHDLSDAKRQKWLLDYIQAGSESAALLLLKTEWDFAVKKLNDLQVIQILQALPKKTVESERFAKEMLVSPRGTSVWQQASLRLYEYAGEAIPTDWNYETSLAYFVPDKAPVAKQPVSPPKQAPKKAPALVAAAAKPAAKKAQAASSQDRLYIVQEGDSLWKISRRFGVDIEVLKKRNQLQSSNLKPGTVLKIP